MPAESLDIPKNPNEQFQRYINEAFRECQALSFAEKAQGLWTKPEILRYYAELPADESNIHLAESLAQILPNIEKKKILIVGGAVGRLGRYIAATDSNSSVTEVDTSNKMTDEANRLARENGQNNFVSIVADARAIPFKDAEYDYAVAHGLFRYLSLEDQQIIVKEMLRVSKYGATIAEGKARDIIYSLKDSIDPKLLIKETKIPMLRTSLFFMLLKKYENNQQFRLLVNQKNKDKPIELLAQLAGVSEGTLYELRLKSNH